MGRTQVFFQQPVKSKKKSPTKSSFRRKPEFRLRKTSADRPILGVGIRWRVKRKWNSGPGPFPDILATNQRSDAGTPAQRGAQLAKPNYQFEKRQKDIAKKKKNEEKRQRKLEKKNVQADGAPEPLLDEAPKGVE